jgi:hypothetical protein
MIGGGTAHRGAAACLGDDPRGQTISAFAFPAKYVQVSGLWSIVRPPGAPQPIMGAARCGWAGFRLLFRNPKYLPGKYMAGSGSWRRSGVNMIGRRFAVTAIPPHNTVASAP